MIPACAAVRVPFANRIAAGFECKRVEVRRAFPQLLTLIEASALLHHRQRAKDADGRLLATATDYQIARRLISKSFAVSLGGGVSESAIRFFHKLQAKVTGVFTGREAKKMGGVGKSAVYGWLSELHESGAVELVEPARGRTPAKWELTGNEPDPGAAVLPTVDSVFPELEPLRNHGHDTKAIELPRV
jgi:hypothetical protein